jgi:hypothetical protein
VRHQKLLLLLLLLLYLALPGSIARAVVCCSIQHRYRHPGQLEAAHYSAAARDQAHPAALFAAAAAFVLPLLHRDKAGHATSHENMRLACCVWPAP